MGSFDKILPPSPEKIKFTIGEYTLAKETHPERNDDAVLSLPVLGAFAVFDGIGGYSGGDIASGMARDGFTKELESLPSGIDLETAKNIIIEIFLEINNSILDEANIKPELSKMGTTASFVLIIREINGKRKLLIVNAGDSRVYVLKANKILEQVTIDDGLTTNKEMQLKFNDAENSDKFDDEEGFYWRNRNIISNPLGRPDFKPRITIIDFEDKDTILITSDGIHDNLTTKEIIKILIEKTNNKEKASGLVEAARKRSQEGGFRSKRDDMTALVVSEVI